MLLGGVGTQTPSNAQVPVLPSVAAHIGDWTFVPAALGSTIEGYLMRAAPGTTTGNNLTVLWFERLPNDTWAGWGWPSGNICDAVDFARSNLQAPALFAESIEVSERLAACSAMLTQPTPFVSGVLIDDPLSYFMDGTAQSSQIVQELASEGGAYAPLLSSFGAYSNEGEVHMPTGCILPDEEMLLSMDLLLNTIARKDEMTHFGGSAIPASAAGFFCWCSSTVTKVAAPDLITTRDVGSVRHCIVSKRSTVTTSYTGSTFWCCAACPAATVKTVTDSCFEFTAGDPLSPCAGQIATATQIPLPLRLCP